jgi:Rne/Rng family ribonuclease
MTRDLIVSTTPQETKVALLEDGAVSEIFIERAAHHGIVGNVYKGRVTRVLPGMQSAFVDIGQERDAFLYVSDFFEDNDEYDKIDLGRALGSYTVTTIGGVNIYSREFEKGYVYVNPTANNVASVTLPQASRQLTHGNLVKVGAHDVAHVR